MIISRGRGYIFVHIPKTGGTSMAAALEARAMKDDILIGDTEKAATNFEIVDRLGGADFLTLQNLGTIYLNDELYAMSVDAYLRAMKLEGRVGHSDMLAIANRLAMLSQYGEASRLVVSGDVLFAGSIGRTDLPGGSYERLMRTIREIVVPLGDDVRVFPGHGPPTTIDSERTSNPFLIAAASS